MKFYAPFKLSENISETPEGYLLCLGVSIGRSGEMVYGPKETPLEVGPEGTVIVSRTAEELFRPETVASFEGKAVTIQHPAEFVSPQNWSTLAKGILQGVRRGKGEQENDLVADLLITDSVAIGLVKDGLREVSCGYEAEYTQTGVGRGVQTCILGNHLALVSEGRAGSSYAINDHNGKGSKMKLKERIAAIFAKAQDEAIKAASEDGNMETPQTVKGFVTLQEVKDYFDDKFEKMSGSKEQKDASTPPTQGTPAKIEAKDDEVASGLEARLTKLEEMVSKLVGMQGDEAGEEEESEDDDFEESTMTGDTGDAARVEILAPGMTADQKNVKAKALIACYATKDGKAAIDQFTGGKAPDLKDDKMVDTLFVGVSEVLKVSRKGDLSTARTKVRDDFQSMLSVPQGAKTAEEINEINAKHWNRK